jgi:WD40 repeat protein
MSGEPNGVFERERRLDDVLGDDGEVKFWSAFTGQELLSLDQYRGRICSLAFPPDGRTSATSRAVDGPEGGPYLWLTAGAPEAEESDSAGAAATPP